MPFAEWDDIRLFYEQRGEGPRLLLISGTNGDLGRRPSVLESPLARRFDLLAGSTCFVSETRCHVWMAPGWQGIFRACVQGAASCGHVCGLLLRHGMAAGPDGNRGSRPDHCGGVQMPHDS
jgi:hypothetical protein